MNEYNSEEVFIFFIKLEEKLPEMFFHLANCLADYRIKLVPISPEELRKLRHVNREYVITLCPDLGGKKSLLGLRKRYLDYMILGRKFCHFDLSSFNQSDLSGKTMRTNSYYHYRLPISLAESAKDIAIKIYKDRKTNVRWPGGKRAKLPIGAALL